MVKPTLQDEMSAARAETADNARTLQAALIWIATAAAFFLAWELRSFFLVAMGAVATAVLLRQFAAIIARLTGLGIRISLGAAVLITVGIVALVLWRFGAVLGGQLNELLSHVDSGLQSLRTMLHDSGFDSLGSKMAVDGTTYIAGSIKNLASIGLGFAEAALIIVVTAVYLSAEPALYRRGLVVMLRPLYGDAVDRHVEQIGMALHLWLQAQLILMLIVFALTLPALWLIGLPNAFALAVIAGLAEAIPYLGPFISAVPALLVALTVGVWPVIWTTAIYVVVHIIEGYFAAPLIERYFVTIPPAVMLGGIVVVDLVFGTPGLIVAAPMTVIVYVGARLLAGHEHDLQ